MKRLFWKNDDNMYLVTGISSKEWIDFMVWLNNTQYSGCTGFSTWQSENEYESIHTIDATDSRDAREEIEEYFSANIVGMVIVE